MLLFACSQWGRGGSILYLFQTPNFTDLYDLLSGLGVQYCFMFYHLKSRFPITNCVRVGKGSLKPIKHFTSLERIRYRTSRPLNTARVNESNSLDGVTVVAPAKKEKPCNLVSGNIGIIEDFSQFSWDKSEPNKLATTMSQQILRVVWNLLFTLLFGACEYIKYSSFINQVIWWRNSEDWDEKF